MGLGAERLVKLDEPIGKFDRRSFGVGWKHQWANSFSPVDFNADCLLRLPLRGFNHPALPFFLEIKEEVIPRLAGNQGSLFMTPSGEYVIEIGLYDWQTGKRLPLADQSGDSVWLGKIYVH